MKSYFLEIPVLLIHEHERYPDRDTLYIYEHLRHTLSHARIFPLPAIDVGLLDGKLVVTGGHKYFRVARDLGRPWVRAVFRSASQTQTDVLKKLPPGVRVTPREVLEREEATQVVREYHVYFFEHPLSLETQNRFLTDIARFFERLDSPLIGLSDKRLLQWAFPFEARCAEFEALIPIGDRSWHADYLETCRAFSRDVQRIVSFQGARFPN